MSLGRCIMREGSQCDAKQFLRKILKNLIACFIKISQISSTEEVMKKFSEFFSISGQFANEKISVS